MIVRATDFRLLQQLKSVSDTLSIEATGPGWMVVATKGEKEVTEHGTLFQCLTAILTKFGVSADEMEIGSCIR